MKYPVADILITIAIEDQALVANILPVNSFPTCEVWEMTYIPLECTAWINILEKRHNGRER